MEKMIVFGKQEMNFDTKEGNHIEGIKLHCTKDIPNAHWVGRAYEGIFVSVKSDNYKLARDIPVDATIDVSFNRWGKPETFSLCK